MNAREIIGVARLKVVHREQYLSRALFRLHLVERPGLGTMAVDARCRLWYDPEFVVKNQAVSVAGVLVHEVHHILRDHLGRIGQRVPVRFNVAADIEIYDDIFQRWVLPGEPLTPAMFGLPEKLTAEEYYAKLPEGVRGSGVGAGLCGGCAGNPLGEWENVGSSKKDDEGGRGGKSKDGSENIPPGLSQAEIEILRRQVAQDIIESRSRGSIPAGLLVWAEEYLAPPKVDWRKVLARHVRRAISVRAGQSDYSYKRFSRSYWSLRKMLGLGAPVLPGLMCPTPKVAVVVDTSGSMTGDPLKQALSEVLGIVRAVGGDVVAIGCDAEVHAKARVFGKADVSKVAVGGGGTDMRVGVAEAEKQHADVIVLLTDGMTPWPEPQEMPRARFIVGLVRDTEVPQHLKNAVVKIPLDGE